MAIIEVPNHGMVEFPDSMSDADIVSAIKKTALDYTPPVQFPIKMGKDAWPDDLRSELQGASWGARNYAGAGTALSNIWEGAKQFVGKGDQQAIENNKIMEDEAPIGALAGNVALTAVPFAKAGSGFKAAGTVGAGFGLAQPVSGEQSLSNILQGKAINTGLGGLSSAAGQFLANKALSGVSGALSGIREKVKDKAAQFAASETASARGVAGNAAQNAYRQLEHLRELGANRALTDAEAMTVKTLERELAEKTLEKLMPAAALKESTAAAYKEAMETEADRAAKYAADKLSGTEAKQQFMARLKRYGPAAAGGIIGNMLLPGLGGSVGGAATGLVLRPAIRSMVNLSKNPAVQHGMLSPFENSKLFTSPAFPISSLLTAEGLLGQ